MSHTRPVTRDTFNSLPTMPGPCNNKRKAQKKQHIKRDKKPTLPAHPDPPKPHDDDLYLDESPCDPPIPYDEGILIATPNIYDPGNGPRVRDTRAFLSSFFAQPPALEDPLCAEFAQEEILQMLCTVLPEETAIVCMFIGLCWFTGTNIYADPVV